MYTDELYHKGTPQEFDNDPHGSGRFRQGTGENPHQHAADFRTRYLQLKEKYGNDKTAIAKEMEMPRRELDSVLSYQKALKTTNDYNQVRLLKKEHPRMTNTEIANIVGMTEGNVRKILKKSQEDANSKLLSTVNVLKKEVDKKKILDISKGTVEGSSKLDGISADRLDKAAIILQRNYGYMYGSVNISQVQDYKKKTKTKVLAKPGIDKAYIYKNVDKIKPFNDYQTMDCGDTWYKTEYPSSIDRKRVLVRYKEEGGADKDGTIEIRRGVPDLDLAGKQYAQVRIAVDNKEYMKGMAYLSDDIPDGYDIVYNSNKKKGSPDSDVFKEFKKTATGEVDKDNPFGAVLDEAVGQRYYDDPNTGEKKLSPINIVKPQGKWFEYRKDLPSQFLSKQDAKLVKQQTSLMFDQKKTEFEDIKKVKNPAIRQKMLQDFGDGCDKSAYELRGAALPNQSTKVILPVTSLKDNEIYAPQYKQGEEVVLVRYPCAGLFEIPRLKVNNRNKEGINTVTPSSEDAVGINPTVATQLSGADFDGDTVVVIPTKNYKINNRDPYKELLNFDTKEYKALEDPNGRYLIDGKRYSGKRMFVDEDQKDTQMGICSNLITDMTLSGGATDDEMIRATKYSMVVIDALKHKLDWGQAQEDFRIKELHKKYQGKTAGGASTIVSRAKGPIKVIDIPQTGGIDPKTGEYTLRTRPNTKFDKKTGEYVPAEVEKKKMETVKDAYDLISTKSYNKKTGKWERNDNPSANPKEIIYADYANNLKKLANQARLESLKAAKDIHTDKEMTKKYSEEVKSISDKLAEQRKYNPIEREAQRQASYIVRAKVEEFGGWDSVDDDQLKKIKKQALDGTRARLGSKRPELKLSPKEWEAVDNGALTKSTIQELMDRLDSDYLREKAIPSTKGKIPASKLSRMRNMLARGYTIKEISESLNISISTIQEYK